MKRVRSPWLPLASRGGLGTRRPRLQELDVVCFSRGRVSELEAEPRNTAAALSDGQRCQHLPHRHKVMGQLALRPEDMGCVERRCTSTFRYETKSRSAFRSKDTR